MPGALEHNLLVVAVLLLFSIIASKGADRLGIPALLIFIIFGIILGTTQSTPLLEYAMAKDLAVIALVFILFAGGLDTVWTSIRPVLIPGIALSTIGVLLTTLLVGWFATKISSLNLLEGLLLGATVSSTDAAAVFSVLRSRGVSLKGKIKPLLELESGSNDPMAVFLTIGFLRLLLETQTSPFVLIPMFFKQMAIGSALGFAIGRASIGLINQLKLEYEGLYPVLSIALVGFTYGSTEIIGGNGFLAVYITGLILGNANFLRRRSLMLFHDGLAWLMQITMFLTLGILINPKNLLTVVVTGLLLSAFLIFIARPISVFTTLIPARFPVRETLLVSWVGLRGALPIILATYPLLAGIPQASYIFNLVFFIVLTSVLIQGTSIASLAKWLKVDSPLRPAFRYPIEYVPTGNLKSELVDFEVPKHSNVIGMSLVDLELPKNTLVVLIQRKGEVIVPRGSTTLKASDTMLVLADRNAQEKIRALLKA